MLVGFTNEKLNSINYNSLNSKNLNLVRNISDSKFYSGSSSMVELGTVDPQAWVRFPPTAPCSNKPCGLKTQEKKNEKNKTKNKSKGG